MPGLNMKNQISNQDVLEYYKYVYFLIIIAEIPSKTDINKLCLVYLLLSWVLLWEKYGYIYRMVLLLLKVSVTCDNILNQFYRYRSHFTNVHLNADVFQDTRNEVQCTNMLVALQNHLQRSKLYELCILYEKKFYYALKNKLHG